LTTSTFPETILAVHEPIDNETTAAVESAVPATLPEASLRELMNARLVASFLARGDEGGFVVGAKIGDGPGRPAILGNIRGGPRVFASLGTVAVLLQKFGFTQFMVGSAKHVPGRVRATKPDRSAAMRSTTDPLKSSMNATTRKR
jgi:hypothetical protein